MLELPKKLNPKDVFAVGVIWTNETNSYHVENAFDDLTRFFEPSIHKGIIYLMRYNKKDRENQNVTRERLAAVTLEDTMLVLGWTVAMYTIYQSTPEITDILKDIVNSLFTYLDEQGIRQAIGFVVTQEPILRSLRGFCRRCGYKIHQCTWSKQKDSADQYVAQKAPEKLNGTETTDPNKGVDLKGKDKGESLVQEKTSGTTDETSDRRKPVKSKDSITSRLRKAQEEGDTDKIQKVLDELEELRKEAKELNEKEPILVTT